MEYPTITRARLTGYPYPIDEAHHGTDFFGNEIVRGEDVVEIDGDLVLQDDLQKYLSEVYHAKFYTAE
jgi:Hypothetical protein Yqai